MAIQLICDACGVLCEDRDAIVNTPRGGGKVVGACGLPDYHLCAECFVWLQGALREHRAEACRVADLVCEPPEAP